MTRARRQTILKDLLDFGFGRAWMGAGAMVMAVVSLSRLGRRPRSNRRSDPEVTE